MQECLEELGDVDDTLEIYLNRHSRRSHTVYLLVLMVFLGGLLALPLVRVQVSVGARGFVRPAVERHEVRVAAGGVVQEVRVRRGDRVERESVMVVLDSNGIRARLAAVERRRREIGQLMQGLRLLSEDPRHAVVVSSELIADQRHLLDEMQGKELRLDYLGEELARTRELVQAGLTPRREATDLEHQLRQATAELEVAATSRKAAWLTKLAELNGEDTRLAAELEQLQSEIALLSLVAPAAGTVEELQAISAGSVLRAGDVISVISPDDRLMVEVFVPPGDVGILQVGMPARILIDAFPYLDWGFLTGRISDISGDYLLIDQRPAFRVSVDLDADSLRLSSGFVGELRKGMSLQTRFLLSERSLLQILRDDVSDWVHPWSASQPRPTGVG